MYQLIIFDVDGTFYDLNDVVSDNYNMQVDFWATEKNLSKESVKILFAQNNILPYKSEKARSATEFFLRNGVEIDTWRRYREAHSSPCNIRKETAVSNELLAGFAELSKLVLLSSNTSANIRDILNWLELEEGLFEAVFCSTSETGGKTFSKKMMFHYILDRYEVESNAVLAVGDRYETDIGPLVNLGGSGVLVRKPADLKELYRDLCEGGPGKREHCSYRFYQG